MTRTINPLCHIFAGIVLASLCCAKLVWAQGTAFTYQGKLTDAGNPANGNYDLQFKLFDALSGGTQQGATLTRTPVAVSAGIFTVTLDFGASVFGGADRFLEIGVRPASSANPYTLLTPRQSITSSPYAIQTLNAQQLGGIAASQYVTTTNGGTSFIRNTTTQQASSNFNISGNGIVGGNLGVGTTNPTAKLEVLNTTGEGLAVTNGTARLRTTFTGNTTFFGTSTNTSLNLHANSGANGGLHLENTGNIGIGTIFPNHKLMIDTLSGPTWTNDGWGGAIALRNSSAIGWQFNSSNLSFGIGQSTGGLSLFRTTNSPGTSGNTPTYDLVISNQGNVSIGTTAPNAKLFVQGEAASGVGIAATGNASQSRNKGGWVKAMVFVLANGMIARCYNGLTGASTGNCGFNASLDGSGFYSVNFGFDVSDRFLALTTYGTTEHIGGRLGGVSGVSAFVRTFYTYNTTSFEGVVSDFFLIVF